MRQRIRDLWNNITSAWESLLERLPWWTEKRYIKKILEPITPDFPKVKERFLKRKQYFKLRAHLEWLGSWHECFNRLGAITGTWMEIVYLKVDKHLADIQPFMYELLDEGWEVTETKDGRRRRKYTLEHEDWHTRIFVVASIGRDARCEVIEHEERKVETVRTYEIMCEGETELVGEKS